jgi:hypothetical protein
MNPVQQYRTITLRAPLVLMVCKMLYGCREQYVPKIKKVNLNNTIEDVFINTSADTKCSRAELITDCPFNKQSQNG